jgi:hypothetical protein
MRVATLIFAASTLVAAYACSSSSDGGAPADGGSDATQEPPVCPNDLPGACPSPQPSYTNEVSAIIETKCNGCHADGGVGQSTEDFSTYDRIHGRRGPILNQVFSCQMPPPDAGQLTPAERAALLGWLVCEAPNN